MSKEKGIQIPNQAYMIIEPWKVEGMTENNDHDTVTITVRKSGLVEGVDSFKHKGEEYYADWGQDD